MTQEPKLGRRIVSKGEYAKATAKRLFLAALSVVLLLVASQGFYTTVYVVRRTINAHTAQLFTSGSQPKILLLPLCFCSIFGAATLIILTGRWGINILQKAKQIDPGVPVTCANAADLPAPDSLVRASQEPTQAQEGVLLRAASGETPPGQEAQLLRASVGETE